MMTLAGSPAQSEWAAPFERFCLANVRQTRQATDHIWLVLLGPASILTLDIRQIQLGCQHHRRRFNKFLIKSFRLLPAALLLIVSGQ
jgi:hypothetical protein